MNELKAALLVACTKIILRCVREGLAPNSDTAKLLREFAQDHDTECNVPDCIAGRALRIVADVAELPDLSETNLDNLLLARIDTEVLLAQQINGLTN